MAGMKVSIRELMAQTGVKFGTSGARGLATDMTDLVCYAYTRGFLQYLGATGELKGQDLEVAVAGDLRPSTDRIMEAVIRAVEDMGFQPVNCGKIPSPALALYGFEQGIPSIMVTGSHIPADRNGIKFNKTAGEVLKQDEAGIQAQEVDLAAGLFDASGVFVQQASRLRPLRSAAREQYARRYLDCFGPTALAGAKIGVYQHSAVGRELLVEILRGLGAETTAFGASESFVPVDTEAIRPEDTRLAADWMAAHRCDALVSTDGDSDRPLLGDERGRWLRGDLAGILCAKFLGADSVSTPVSCNSAVEKCGWFREVRRTRIGSPYVVASMLEATAKGAQCVVGYEANGGFLLKSDLLLDGRVLRALPTRDAVILLLSVLLLARREGKTLSELAAMLPARFTASGLLRDCPPDQSERILRWFTTGDPPADRQAFEAVFGTHCGKVRTVDRTDGIRCTFENEEVIHLRPSGNAPEFRCYTEAASLERAERLSEVCLSILRNLGQPPRFDKGALEP